MIRKREKIAVNFLPVTCCYLLCIYTNNVDENEKKALRNSGKISYLHLFKMQMESQLNKNIFIRTLFKLLVSSGYEGVKAAIIR